MNTKERIQAAIRENPNQMTMLLARQFGVPEVEVVRAFPDDRAVELDAQCWEELIRRLEAFGKVHVLVSNGGATLEGNRSRVEGDPCRLSTLRLRRGGHGSFVVHQKQNSPGWRSGVTARISLRVLLYSVQPF
jgi:hypothetical protein